MSIRTGVLIDLMPLTYKLEEDISGQKKIRMRGPLSEGNCKNRNNRYYPMPLLEREINKLQPDIQAKKVIGELDHPNDLKIHLDRVSHFITEAHFEGNKLCGTIEVIEGTPCGDILAGLVKSGVQFGISSRAMGSVARGSDGVDVVQEDFSLLTWDIVAQPSNYSSWLSLSESASLLNSYDDLESIIEKKLGNKIEDLYPVKTLDSILRGI